jgi:hypothetical protein
MEHDPDIPEPLQRICLKAMEARPEERYPTAELMQRDLGRFCEGRPVLVRPVAYLRELAGRVRNHLSEIQLWERQGFISRRERDVLAGPYGRVLAVDSPWWSETRRVLAGPLFLRVGAWLMLLSALLWPAFYWDRLGPAARVASAGVPAGLMAALGVGYLASGNRRNALACLGWFALLLLVLEVVLLSEFRWLEFPQPAEWELWGAKLHNARGGGELMLSNSQTFAAALTVTACLALLLRCLRAPFFALWLAAASVALFSAALLLAGDKERLMTERVAWVALHYLGFGAGLYALGYGLERRAGDRVARPFYFVAAGSLLAAAVALAWSGTEEWFGEDWDFDNVVWNLWLMIYSAPLFVGAWLCERFGTEAQRTLARVGYLLVPVFLLIPLNVLFGRSGPELFVLGPRPVRVYELLYLAACVGLLAGGKYLRIETFLLAGLWGAAVWVFRVTHYHLGDRPEWPLLVGFTGGCFAALGVWYSRRAGGPQAGEAPPDTELHGAATEPHEPPQGTATSPS